MVTITGVFKTRNKPTVESFNLRVGNDAPRINSMNACGTWRHVIDEKSIGSIIPLDLATKWVKWILVNCPNLVRVELNRID